MDANKASLALQRVSVGRCGKTAKSGEKEEKIAA
jgi:hypothetical protein